MSQRLLLIGWILPAVALVATAADAVTGQWAYAQQGRAGGQPRSITLDLKADGAKLTGTILLPAGRGADGEPPTPTAITNGKVDGNNISFEVTRDFGGNSMTMKYEGVVSGSEMKLKITRPGFQGGGAPMASEVTAKFLGRCPPCCTPNCR